MSETQDAAQLARLETLDGEILRALDDVEQALPEALMAERDTLLYAIFSGRIEAALAAPLREAIERHKKIEWLARQRQSLVTQAREKLRFSHQAVAAYLENQG